MRVINLNSRQETGQIKETSKPLAHNLFARLDMIYHVFQHCRKTLCKDKDSIESYRWPWLIQIDHKTICHECVWVRSVGGECESSCYRWHTCVYKQISLIKIVELKRGCLKFIIRVRYNMSFSVIQRINMEYHPSHGQHS